MHTYIHTQKYKWGKYDKNVCGEYLRKAHDQKTMRKRQPSLEIWWDVT